jgi:hypothetical protein
MDPLHNLGISSTVPAHVRNNSSNQPLATSLSAQTTKNKDSKRTSRSHADNQVKASTLSISASSRLNPSTTSSSTGLAAPSIQPPSTATSTRIVAAGAHGKVGADKHIGSKAPVQRYQVRPRPSFSNSGLWVNPPPPLSQLQTISDSSVNTVATGSSTAPAF